MLTLSPGVFVDGLMCYELIFVEISVVKKII